MAQKKIKFIVFFDIRFYWIESKILIEKGYVSIPVSSPLELLSLMQSLLCILDGIKSYSDGC